MPKNRKISRTFSMMLLLIVLAALLYWLFGLVRGQYLTNKYLDEFDLDSSIVAYLEDDYRVKVLAYDGDEALLYAYTKELGLQIIYGRGQAGWQYRAWYPIWSNDGTDSLIFPYLHHSGSGRALLVLCAVVALPLLFFTTYRLQKARKGV